MAVDGTEREGEGEDEGEDGGKGDDEDDEDGGRRLKSKKALIWSQTAW